MDTEDVHLAQTKNYLMSYDFDIGLLINVHRTVDRFGATNLQYKRIYHPRLRKNP